MAKTFTIRDLVEAAEKNGLPWDVGSFYMSGRACLVGQIMHNIGVDIRSHHNNRDYISAIGWDIHDKVRTVIDVGLVFINDDSFSYEEAVSKFKAAAAPHMDKEIIIEGMD